MILKEFASNKQLHSQARREAERAWQLPNISGNLTFEKNGEFDDRFR